MSQRYTQDRATTQRHLAILKDLLRQPDNKLCADCKRNDPRWASTNLGVWMCIRCSGHHRGMGVHISRVRSVDLDTWTPEQIHHMQRWGNRRANLYWEAHLKPGHMPPDHKIESFIRSKYELKRWAREGPIPDPETLDGEAPPAAEAVEQAPAPRARKAAPTTSSSLDLLSSGPSVGSATSSRKSTPTTGTTAAARPAEQSLFDLDFDAPAPAAAATTPAPVPTRTTSAAAPRTAHAASPAPTPAPQPKRDPKADILSLFNAAPPIMNRPAQQQQQQQPPSSRPNGHTGGGFGNLDDDFASLSFGGGSGAMPRSTSTTSDFGGFASAPSAAAFGGDSGHFGGSGSGAAMPPPVPLVGGNASAAAAAVSTDPWASSSASAWGNPTPAAAPSYSQPQQQQQQAKPDPFADFGAFTASSSSTTTTTMGGGGGQFGGDIWGSSNISAGTGSGTGTSTGGFSDIWN